MFIRNPGKHVFWVVQSTRIGRDKDDWGDVSDTMIAQVPKERRHGPTYGSKDQEPFASWNASGSVWQETGNHGFYEASKAFELAELLTTHIIAYKFRAVKVALDMKYEVVAELEKSPA